MEAVPILHSMITLLSPAKKLNFSPAPTELASSPPSLQRETNSLAKITKKLSRTDLVALMGISETLADLTYQRFQAFNPRPAADITKQAAFAFNGDVYLGLEAANLAPKDLAYAQDHLRILSGLYGILRPLDAMQPYRLEMGSRLHTPRGTNLYHFWGDKIAQQINQDMVAQNSQAVVNLASNEYFKAVDKKTLAYPVLTPSFREEKDGESRVIMHYAKKARGQMARWIIQQQVNTPNSLKEFDQEGYRFRPALSEGANLVFSRKQPPPKK